jgi:hypothetical protein
MSLTNVQLETLAEKMGINLARVCFKNELHEEPLIYNAGYIVNMEDEVDDSGRRNSGSHWVALYIQKTPNGTIQPIYFDSFACPPPEDVLKFCGRTHIPYSTVDVQSIVEGVCGYYCLALLYYVSVMPERTGCLYTDSEDFTSLFNDLSKSSDWKHNEFILKHFFQSSDPEVRARNPLDPHEGMTFVADK